MENNMKKILLLSSVFCIFLSACGNASIPVTPTSTLLPPATATGAPPATEAPTTIPTTIATAAPTEGPAKVETQVDKIEHDTIENLTSQSFFQWVFDTEAKGGFPKNTNATPLTSINAFAPENQSFFDKYGHNGFFEISQADAQVYLNDRSKIPWSLVAVREFEINGQKLYYLLIRWENSDKTDGNKTQAGFTGQILVPVDRNLKDLKDDPGYQVLFGSQSKVPTGVYFAPNRIEGSEYIKTRGVPGKVFAQWYKRNLKIFDNQTFWEQCKTDGKITNEEQYIPLSAQGGTTY
jgi:hypothetical protein